MLQYSELIQTIILQPIAIPDDELNFKIEILKNAQKQFYARLFRLEMYQVTPSFIDTCADEVQYVLDIHTLPGLETHFQNTAAACLNSALHLLQNKFNIV